MSHIWQDIKFALVGLRRAPGFTAAAMLTLTIGIAAVCAVFTLVNAVLLRPLPYPDADRIVFLRGEMRKDTPRGYPLSYLDLTETGPLDRVFERITPLSSARPFNLAFGSEVEHVNGEMVAGEFFDLVGLPLTRGRGFQPAEARAPSAVPVVVLAHGFWTRRFGADPAIVGRTIHLNERSFEVVGIAAPGFRGVSGSADLWLPIGMAGPIYGPHYTDMRQFRWLSGLGRLKPGVSIDQARDALESWALAMADQHPDTNKDLFVAATPLQEALVGSTRGPLLALLGASAFVLLIGSVNVANLLLARGLSREREVAVRRALGAGSGRILRQFLTEGIVLALPACAAGTLLAGSLTTALSAIWAADLETFVTIGVDGRVLAVTVLVSIASAVGFAIVPAVAAARVSPQRGLAQGTRGGTASRARRRFQSGLVVAEVALAVALVAGSALMVRGFAAHISADLGFDPDDLLTVRLDLSADQFKDNMRFWNTARAVLEAAAASPGVTAAALEGPSYPTGGYFAAHFRRYGAPETDPQVSALRHHVSPGYFRTMGATLLAGRDIDWSDTPAAPRAVIVSETLAKRTWPGEDPIGQRLQSIGPDATIWTVVGVVRDIRHEGLATTEARDPHIYLSIFQSPARSPSHVAVLARTSTAAAREALADAIGRAAPGVPPYDMRTVRARLDEQTVQDRAAIQLMAGFGLAALVLAAIGVYGVIAYTVTTRTREIGIRAALGASRADAVKLVLWQAVLPTAIGVAAGLAIVAILQRFVQNLLFGAPAADPIVLAATSAGLLLVGLAAAALPAWRAARIQPVVALGND